MQEMTQYHNSLNAIPMRLWSEEEQNFFFGIITQARDKGTDLLKFSKKDLQEFADYKNKNSKDFRNTMKKLSDKLENLRYREETSNSYASMVLFQRFYATWSEDLSDMSLEIRVSEDFEYILNRLQAEFTKFELKQFTNIRSTYAKTMYRILKQWRTIGKKEFSKKELFDFLEVPKSTQRATNFNERVLKPIQKELGPYFLGLKIVPIKTKTRGNPVTGYKFTWQAEQTGEWKNFNKLKKKPKKNIRNEVVPDGIQEAEQEAIEKGKQLQADYFNLAMELRNKTFEEQSLFFSEAREIDTYRMPEGSQFLNTLATLMLFDTEKYWTQILGTESAETEK